MGDRKRNHYLQTGEERKIMQIGIDANEANQRNRVGVGQFAYNVIFQLEKIDKENSYLIYLKEQPLPDLPKEREGWKYLVFGPSKLWTQVALPIKLFTQREEPNVFYSPSHYAPRFSSCPTVISIMDLWHHRHPEQFTKKDLYQLTKWEGYSLKKASHIITISEFSKREILDIYKVPEEKITVAYPGFDRFVLKEKEKRIGEIRERWKIGGDYLLYLGTLQPKKNLVRLVQSLNILISRYPSITLVIAGKKGWLYEEIFSEVKKLGLEEKVVFTGFVSEEEKPHLLKEAKVFLFPSLYEGFGIPVLEAMSMGVPVVTSKEGSLPEVGGEAAIYCDPYNVESIAEAVREVLNLNENARNEIIRKGLEQVKKFSWERCAKTVLEALEGTKKREKNVNKGC